MAYIQPNSTVEFFADIGIDPSYENTLYFSSVSAKDNYFSNLTKITTATALSYSRESRGFIRVEKPMSTMIRAGYMRFKNTSFEDKWWYAFVTSVEYINNVTTQVNFVLDVMMTWMGAFSLKECYIERQHETVDYPGSNIVDENLDTGEYMTERVAATGFTGINEAYVLRQWAVCVASTVAVINDDVEDVTGGAYAGIYSGCHFYYFDTIADANDYLDKLTEKGKADAIVAISLVPKNFVPVLNDTGVLTWGSYSHAKPYNSINGWTGFKNKKILTYPYKMLLLSNMEGEFAEYRYEFFDGNNYTFRGTGVSSVNAEFIVTPENYKSQSKDITDHMVMSHFPVCSWNIDTFKAWYAQNKSSFWTSMVTNFTTGVAQTAIGAAKIGMGASIAGVGGIGVSDVANTVMAGKKTVDGIANDLAKVADYSRKPPTFGGQVGGDILVSVGAKDFFVVEKAITREYAKMIDDYFTLFGYAIKEVRTPNMNARPHWSYIKTVGCTLDGELPADDAATIEGIFDSGIRFWKDHTKIGHYSLYNNAPV